MRQTPEIPANCQWAMFLRNHDELTLEMVTDAERDYLWSTYAANPRARINLGIRRRLAPLMDNDRRKIELMNSILMSMPGTPIIYYGDEIGMGDNIYLGDRNGVRTPMQWTPDRNGGFSRTDPAQLYLPCIMDPVYGYAAVNVEAQTRSLSSLLSWMKRLIGVRKSHKVFGRGTLTFIRPSNRAVLAYVRQLDGEAILCVANLSRSAQAVELDLSAFKGRIPQEMLGRARFPRIGELPYLVTLPPYGFFWFLLGEDAEPAQEKVLPREVTTLVVGTSTMLSGWTRRTFETDVLPSYLPERRWFGDKGQRRITATLSVSIAIEHGPDRFVIAIADVTGAHGVSRYFLPLTIRWIRYTQVDRKPAAVLAAVRRGPREGTLLDATGEMEFVTALLAKMRAGETAGSESHKVEFRATSAMAAIPEKEIQKVNAADREQSNTSIIVDDTYVIKILRKVAPGLHPEIEIGRFLTDVAHFKNAPALLGTVELVEDGGSSALAVVHAFVENQGDAWTVISAALDRLVDEQRLLPNEMIAETSEIATMLQWMRQIGKRTAELHRAFATETDNDAFKAEAIAPDDTTRWTDQLLERVRNVFALLESNLKQLPEASGHVARQLLGHREAIVAHIEANWNDTFDGTKIRHHGDFHLGQVLIAKDDAYILDFEGEPRRSLEDRRRKAPPARDVAGFIRSIDYATSAALGREADIKPEEMAAMTEQVRGWGERMTSVYWDAYREAMGDAHLWPKDEKQVQQLLDLFLLEKVFYEIEYELTNRPDWSHIPLEAALRILRQHGVITS
jgi:maltose alpha-D-glucosyltransferase/alpha-amylase